MATNIKLTLFKKEKAKLKIIKSWQIMSTFFLFSITKQMFAATLYVNLPPNKYLVYIIRRRVRERTWAVSAYQDLIWQFSVAFRVFCLAAFFPETNGLPLGLCLRRSPNNLTLRRQPNICLFKKKKFPLLLTEAGTPHMAKCHSFSGFFIWQN